MAFSRQVCLGGNGRTESAAVVGNSRGGFDGELFQILLHSEGVYVDVWCVAA